MLTGNGPALSLMPSSTNLVPEKLKFISPHESSCAPANEIVPSRVAARRTSTAAEPFIRCRSVRVSAACSRRCLFMSGVPFGFKRGSRHLPSPLLRVGRTRRKMSRSATQWAKWPIQAATSARRSLRFGHRHPRRPARRIHGDGGSRSRQPQPSSCNRSSSIPKWWASSCTTVTCTSWTSSSRSAHMSMSDNR